jgi:hypothetical protein
VYEVSTGHAAWAITEGSTHGQTQLAELDDSLYSNWAHPVEVQMTCGTIEAWPRFVVQVWTQDEFKRNSIGTFVVTPDKFAPHGCCVHYSWLRLSVHPHETGHSFN